VYVHKQFVDPVGPADGAVAQTTPAAAAAGEAMVVSTPTDPQAPGQQPAHAASPAETAAAPAVEAVAEAPSTQPSTRPAAVEARFDEVEAQFSAASELPIDQQPLDELRTRYEDLLADQTLPESMRRIAEFRLQAIKLRGDAMSELAALKRSQEEAQQRQVALKAEQDELAEQIRRNSVRVYAAVGKLQTSSLQQGRQTLYRLTDPNTGRTVVYIRSNDSAITGYLGQFIGVKGTLETDARLSMKVVSPEAVEAVEPGELYRTVAATVVPPSMLPKAQASTGGEAAPTE
jgi:hypothetical protein